MHARTCLTFSFALSLAFPLSACSKPPEKQKADRPGGAPASESEPKNGATGGTAAPSTPEASDLFGAAVIKGRVSYEGDRPAARAISMAGDPVCHRAGAGARDQSREVSADGGVPHVFVYIKQGVSGRYPVPTEAVVLDQVGCVYVPHVLGIQVGQTLTIKNSDPTAHNVHARSTRNAPFNISQPRIGMTTDRTFTREEIMVPVKCDVHGWMSSFAGVVSHPFHAVTDAGGNYEITRLPPGDYELEIWHETFQRQQKKISLKEGETLTLDFVYAKK